MRRQTWFLQKDVPVIEVQLHEPFGGFSATRVLLADSGAGPRFSPFELVLGLADGLRFGSRVINTAHVGGAFQGQFPVRAVTIEIPQLQIKRQTNALIVPDLSAFSDFDGLAAFSFLNAFTYGNFGNPAEFGLELN